MARIIKCVQVMPGKTAILLPKIAASTVVVIIREHVTDSFLNDLAAEIVGRNRELVVVWGAS